MKVDRRRDERPRAAPGRGILLGNAMQKGPSSRAETMPFSGAVRMPRRRRFLPSRRSWQMALLLSLPTSCATVESPPVITPELDPGAALLPVRVRRLSNAEFRRTASELLRGDVEVLSRLPPDVRQSGYTQNAEQTLPAALGTRVAALAEDLAKEAVDARFEKLFDCDARSATCRRNFVETMGRKAWRRPLSSSEIDQLLDLFRVGGATSVSPSESARASVELVLTLLLQSPSLWYLSEMGAENASSSSASVPPRANAVRLSDFEIASSLAYTVRGGPPDERLLELADQGRLGDAEVRVREARRLLGDTETRHHFRRFVLEWLEVDGLLETAKNPELFPAYDAVKSSMLLETASFVDEVMVHEGASLSALLTLGSTSIDPKMARYYGFDVYGPRVSLGGKARLGILQQASFLSAHAHEDSSSPVKRGDFILRKVLCDATPRPRELDIEVTIPPPNPKHTTRQRFAQHAADPNCSFCHSKIDGFGFTFEQFDGAGRLREQDNEQPIDARTRFSFDGQELAFNDSLEVSRWLSQNPKAHECFARQSFRFFSAQAEPEVEDSFLGLLRQVPAGKRESVLEALVAFIGSDLFLWRRRAGSG